MDEYNINIKIHSIEVSTGIFSFQYEVAWDGNVHTALYVDNHSWIHDEDIKRFEEDLKGHHAFSYVVDELNKLM